MNKYLLFFASYIQYTEGKTLVDYTYKNILFSQYVNVYTISYSRAKIIRVQAISKSTI